jgi:hypothetical protein
MGRESIEDCLKTHRRRSAHAMWHARRYLIDSFAECLTRPRGIIPSDLALRRQACRVSFKRVARDGTPHSWDGLKILLWECEALAQKYGITQHRGICMNFSSQASTQKAVFFANLAILTGTNDRNPSKKFCTGVQIKSVLRPIVRKVGLTKLLGVSKFDAIQWAQNHGLQCGLNKDTIRESAQKLPDYATLCGGGTQFHYWRESETRDSGVYIHTFFFEPTVSFRASANIEIESACIWINHSGF